VPSVFSGLAVIIYAFHLGNFTFIWLSLFPFLVVFVSGLIMAYAVSMILTTLSFWLLNATPLPDLAQQIVQMSGRPYQIFGGMWKVIFLMVVPLAFMVTFPAQILLGELVWWWVPASIVLAGVFLYASHKFWNLGLKHYSSASS
jgi:ABC-2 type transport system permease protein